jgi:ligand-binding SRPBCC domain-containing protein
MRAPTFFKDELVHGAFKSYAHEHRFAKLGENRTEKRDVMTLEAPLGPLGRFAEVLFLKRYMTAFLRKKNADLKALLER